MAESNILVKVSAPGKVILHGEHSVVYGKLAVAASLDMRTYVTLKEPKTSTVTIHFQNLNLERKYHAPILNSVLAKPEFENFKENLKQNLLEPEQINLDELMSIIANALNLPAEALEPNEYKSLIAFFCLYFGLLLSTNTPIYPMSIHIKTELSLGSGTGSSASLMVSLTGALLRYITLKNPAVSLTNNLEKMDSFKNDFKNSANFNETELNIISKWAYLAEKIIHGNPSGIDNTICTYGSLVSFRKTRSPIPIKTNDSILGLLVDTKVEKNTLALVQKVADMRKKHARVVDNILNAIEGVADEAIEILIQLTELPKSATEKINKCYETLGELSAVNHQLLCALNVSHPSLDNVIKIMQSRNVVGKLTGAGGGGYAVALIPPTMDKDSLHELCKELDNHGYLATVIHLGGPGIKIEI